MKTKTVKLSSLVLALALSTSGCAWIRGILPGGDDSKVAQAAPADPMPSNAPTVEPARVAGDRGNHVQDGSDETVTSGYGDCVNVGYVADSGQQSADCDKQGLQSATGSGAGVPAAPNMANEKMSEPAPDPVSSTPLDQSGSSARDMVEETDAGSATAQLQPADERPTVAPSYEKISLHGDAVFRFGKSDEGSILPSGIKKLDELAAQLAAYDRNSIDRITVIGHADRLGKKAANQALSERRAQTVRNYFIKNGVDGALIKSMGKGSTQPVKQCQGTKKTPRLIACLEPNRRVEVEIRGIKEN